MLSETPITVAEYQTLIAGLLNDLPKRIVSVPLFDAAGRVLARDVTSPNALPLFDNSQLDGFAVKLPLQANTPVPVSAVVPAGTFPEPLAPGTCAAVMTGSAIPAGSSAVIGVEDTDLGAFTPGSFPTEVSFKVVPKSGAFIRRKGSDLKRKATIVTAESRLTPSALSALASAGISEVFVYAPLIVTVVSTGAELSTASHSSNSSAEERHEAQIFESNSLALKALFTEAGATTNAMVMATDDPETFTRQILTLATNCDLLVTTGGISAGAFEVVRQSLSDLGVSFGKVAMQPGGPQGSGKIATRNGPTPIICLPGNPVSCLISAEMFLRPILLKHHKRWLRNTQRPVLHLPLANDITSPVNKHQVLRARIENEKVHPHGGPSSHLITAYAQSNALIQVPKGTSQLKAGTIVEVWRIDE